MSQISLHVVFDTDTKTFHIEGTESMPVDSDEYVWDAEQDEWRVPTEDEMRLAADAEGYLAELTERAVLT